METFAEACLVFYFSAQLNPTNSKGFKSEDCAGHFIYCLSPVLYWCLSNDIFATTRLVNPTPSS